MYKDMIDNIFKDKDKDIKIINRKYFYLNNRQDKYYKDMINHI